MGQSDVVGDLGDRVVHGGNHRLLGVSLDVMDTFLDGLGQESFCLFCYTMLVHPLLDFPVGYFRDFVLDREGWANKLVTFALLFFCRVPKKLG